MCNRFEMKKSDVVFMYKTQDLNVYKKYGATVLAWGGAHTMAEVRELTNMGIHATGTMWCLTAGAEELHTNPDILEATIRDISGEIIAVPWLPDFIFEGTPSYWGCTNHPAFRAHMRKKVCEAMAGGAHGLHVDDHLGSASPAEWWGGCFCEYCMKAFSTYLCRISTPELLEISGVESFNNFEYKNFVKQYATTREKYIQIQEQIPLHKEFVDCQLQLAAENVRQLGELAEEIVGHKITLSANTGMPQLPHAVVTPYLTYLVGEIEHHAEYGTDKLLEVVKGYRMAEALKRPLAATACGWDNAYVFEHQCETLMRIWIALAYACGQRFMVPAHLWCYTPEKGTHWYDGSNEVYAPFYRFVRKYSELFDNFETVGSLAVPDGIHVELETHEKRMAFQAELDKNNPSPLVLGERLWGFPRKNEENNVVIHLVNLNYIQDTDKVIKKENLEIVIPYKLFGSYCIEANYYRPDYERISVELQTLNNEIRIIIPEIDIWGIIQLVVVK